ncbi:transglycosylase domain-containing protein [Photobacterium swingsii]
MIESVSSINHELPHEYLWVLQLAEDHRNSHHFGVDQLSFFRIVFQRIFRGVKQGGSTIEQQLVRTITSKYELTLRRKIIEQLLAVIVSTKFSKSRIASVYLQVAYLGTNLQGVDSLARKLDLDVHTDSNYLAVECVSRLKYPEPSKSSSAWMKKYNRRKHHVVNLLHKTGNKGIKVTRYTRRFW